MPSWQTSAAEYWSACPDANNLVEWVGKKQLRLQEKKKKTDKIWTNALLWNNGKHLLLSSISLPGSKYDETVCNWSAIFDQWKNSSTAACLLFGLREKNKTKGPFWHPLRTKIWAESPTLNPYLLLSLSLHLRFCIIHPFLYMLRRAAGPAHTGRALYSINNRKVMQSFSPQRNRWLYCAILVL